MLLGTGPLHHAYIVIGDPETAVGKIKEDLDARFGSNFTAADNPDFWLREYATWGVDESRELKDFQARRPIEKPSKVFVIVPSLVTLEAQNSLLKTLEEPAPNTHFLVVAKQLGSFLPTVLSRCLVVRAGGNLFNSELEELASSFLSADIARRWDIIKHLTKREEGDERNSGLDFLNCLLALYWEQHESLMKTHQDFLRGAETLVKGAQYAAARGSSIRLILEHVATIVPVVKMC